jgi:hypothetical protein
VTDQQLLTLALSISIPVSLSIAALIHNNSRISEAKETLRAEIKDETAALRGEMADLRAHLDSGFERMEHALKIHQIEHHK